MASSGLHLGGTNIQPGQDHFGFALPGWPPSVVGDVPVVEEANPFGGPDPGLFWQLTYFAALSALDTPGGGADAARAGGFIPKSDAVLWSGPALIAFPADAHGTGQDAAGSGASGEISGAEPPPRAEIAGSNSPAETPHADGHGSIDPMLTSIASRADDALAAGSSDLGLAFLPREVSGVDPGLDIASRPPDPVPPPPHLI